MFGAIVAGMVTFALVTFVVCGAGIAWGAVFRLTSNRSLDGLGRGGMWFAHEDELPIEDRPSEDGPDSPLPKRALRGRF